MSVNAGHKNFSVSVVIPTVGRSTLRRTIESVISQEALIEEIIVVDNGMRPVQNCNFLRRPKVRILRLPPGLGVAFARNAGADAANTEILAFLDDDDWWGPEYLGAALNAVRSRRGDLCLGAIRFKHADQAETLAVPPSDISPENWKVWIGREFGAYGSNILVRKSCFRKIQGFDRKLTVCEDKDLVLRVAKCGGRVIGEPRAIINVDRSSGRHGITEKRGVLVRLGHARFIMKYKKERGVVPTIRGLCGLIFKK